MGGDQGARRRKVTIAMCSIIMVVMVVAVVVDMSETTEMTANNTTVDDNASTSHITTSQKAVKAMCEPVKYKKTCKETLSKANTTEPRDLMRIGFQAAQKHLAAALKNSTAMEKVEKDPETVKALKVCNEVLDLAIDDLQKSFDKMGEFELSMVDDYLNDIQTWLSGAVTYRVTCLDAFENTTSPTKKKMEKALKTAAEINTNAIAMVNKIQKMVKSLGISERKNRHKLVETKQQIPSWVDPTRRKLLETNRLDLAVGKFANFVVAKDGSGNFTSLMDALANVTVRRDNSTVVIYIKEGVYAEKVMKPGNKSHLILVGDGSDKTIFTGSLNFVDGIKTMHTATFTALGKNFMAVNIGFENTAGAIKEQAVALRVGSDLSIFYNCSIHGYQDTLYTHAHRQYYRDCTISGTIDFIFGGAAAVFQNCNIVLRKPLPNQQLMITAHARVEPGLKTGLVIQNCTISADPEFLPFVNSTRSYLGRPWKAYARTLIMDTQIDDVIDKAGWAVWPGQEFDKTCWFAEFGNRGPGAVKTHRATWSKTIDEADQVVEFAAENFIHAGHWIELSGVPFTKTETMESYI